MQFIDPVCRKKLRKKEEYAIIKYGGNIYHLCCKSCKEAFEQNPLKYIPDKSNAIQPKYIAR